MACCCWQVLSCVRLCNLMDCSQPGSSVHTSVQFSHSVLSDSLRPHELQHARPPCPSPTPGVYPNSCPLSRWCHPTISSAVVPLSSRLQSFPAPGSFQTSQFFASGGQSIEVSASPSVLPKNRRSGLISLGWTGWISILTIPMRYGFAMEGLPWWFRG